MLLLSTWKFGLPANEASIPILKNNGSAMDAVVEAATVTELSPDVQSVGKYSKPNAQGYLQLDAAVMDGTTGACGAVMAMEGIARATQVAREVLRDGRHVNLAGHGAAEFALQHGFQTERLVDERGLQWLEEHQKQQEQEKANGSPEGRDIGHDTIGILAIDSQGHIATACTTSGSGGKLPGRVGDSPIIGSGLYCDDASGGCVATGFGEDILKVCGSFLVVELMRAGIPPQEACQRGIARIAAHFYKSAAKSTPLRQCALLACNMQGAIGAACTTEGFSYAFWDGSRNQLIEAPVWEKDFT